MASFAGVDINSYRSYTAPKGQKDMPRGARNNKSDSESISAWRGSTVHKEGSPWVKEGLLRDVDRFLSTSLPRSSKDPTVQSDIAFKLYRSELARDESEAKLSEWIKVASELQEIVQQQQRRLDNPTLPPDGKRNSPTKAPARQVRKTSPRIAQLHNLVKSVRDELERPACRSQSPNEGRPNSADDTKTAQLQSEIQSLRRQLQQMKISQQQIEITQQEESHVLAAKVDAHHKASAEARAEQERTRRALLDAEMELQRAAAELNTAKRQISEGESARLAQSRHLAGVQNELDIAVQRAEAAEQHSESLVKEREAALQRANETLAAFGRLQGEYAQKVASASASQRAAEAAATELAAAEAKAAAADASCAMERSKCGSLEALVARLQSEILSMERELAESQRCSKTEAATAAAQLEALHDELMVAQRDARRNRKEADASREQINELQYAHSRALDSANSLQEKYLELEAGQEAATRRALHAEAQLATATGAAAERAAAVEAERTLHHENEVRALKEILDKVACAAQQKDAALQRLTAERAELHAAVHASQCMIAKVQAAAAAESTQWEEAYRSAIKVSEDDPPVVLRINVQNEAPTSPGWKEGDPIPSSLQRRLDEEIVRVKQSSEAEKELELAKERREHMGAVRDLEEAHNAALEALRGTLQRTPDEGPKPSESMPIAGSDAWKAAEASEAEAAALREEVCVMRERAHEAQTRLKVAETELLAAQGNAARLNSAVEKLQQKCKHYKEELREVRGEVAEARHISERCALRAEAAEAEVAAARTELADAQDEVEALLTARLQHLSRCPSEVDPGEAADVARMSSLPHGIASGATDESLLRQESSSCTSSMQKHGLEPLDCGYGHGEGERMEEVLLHADDFTAEDIHHRDGQAGAGAGTRRQSRSPLKKLAQLIRGRKPRGPVAAPISSMQEDEEFGPGGSGDGHAFQAPSDIDDDERRQNELYIDYSRDAMQ